MKERGPGEKFQALLMMEISHPKVHSYGEKGAIYPPSPPKDYFPIWIPHNRLVQKLQAKYRVSALLRPH